MKTIEPKVKAIQFAQSGIAQKNATFLEPNNDNKRGILIHSDAASIVVGTKKDAIAMINALTQAVQLGWGK